jgi:integrase/recombinase XerD
MLTRHVKRQTAATAPSTGFAQANLDDFAAWLTQRGYRNASIHRHLQGAGEFVVWARSTGADLQSLSLTTLHDFRDHLSSRGQLFYSKGRHSTRWLGARSFFAFCQHCSPMVTGCPPEVVQPDLLRFFEQWMLVHRGVTRQTLAVYRPHIGDLLTEFGGSPEQFDAAGLRDFILTYAEHSGIAMVKTRAKATRMFLRYLIATERCQPDLEAAIPTIAQWRLSTLPRYLPPGDVERVILSCDTSRAIGIRDKAILLLLARLGLRASEVAGLKFDDIDWPNASFSVIGKTRCEVRLPLPQEVGDALLRYLESARPGLDSDRVFVSAIAPWRPITRYVVKSVTARAIQRAGVEAPSSGAHVLRHSAATTLLSQGASLQVIGEVLRHRSIDTTAHYAKVDVGLLQQVAMAWPGATPC